MANPLDKITTIPPSMTPLTPSQAVMQAVAEGKDTALIEKMIGWSERLEANQARRAFDKAISQAKAEIKPVVRNRQGHNSKMYADFAAIALAVDPIISKFGLSYRFRTNQTDRIFVTCVLSHEAGHSEETTLAGPADATGSKNAIQAIGSTLTYLQRYTLVQALGLAAADDDDGRGAGAGGAINEEQLAQIIALADEVGADKRMFCQYFKVDSLAAIQAKDFDRAIIALNRKRKA